MYNKRDLYLSIIFAFVLGLLLGGLCLAFILDNKGVSISSNKKESKPEIVIENKLDKLIDILEKIPESGWSQDENYTTEIYRIIRLGNINIDVAILFNTLVINHYNVIKNITTKQKSRIVKIYEKAYKRFADKQKQEEKELLEKLIP